MKTIKTIFLTLLATALLALVALGLLAFGGYVDVAATSPGSPLVERFLHVTRERAVEREARTIEVPPLDDPLRVERGLVAYHRLCAGCHGAPGVEPAAAAWGLNPLPPELANAGVEDPARIYWVTENGIRMTGMPAFGPTLGEAELWDLVAAVAVLAETSVEDYERAVGGDEAADGEVGLGEVGVDPAASLGDV
jgi:mono/diheme cytochrome c family protein